MPLISTLFQGNRRLEEIHAGTGKPMSQFRKPEEAAAVRLVQKALCKLFGKMPKSWPSFPNGEPDGDYGGETRQFVIKFQKTAFASFSEWDGDLGRKTLTQLDIKMAGAPVIPAPPVPPPPPAAPVSRGPGASTSAGALTTRIRGLLPKWLARQNSALTILGQASLALTNPAGPDINRKALALVERCFKVSQGTDQAADIRLISSRYQTGARYLTQETTLNAGGLAGTYIFQAPTDIQPVKGNAETYNGPWKGDLSDGSATSGMVFMEDKCNPQNDDWLLDAMTHELAHWSGAGLTPEAYNLAALQLPRAQALQNAANYAWFGGLSQVDSSNWPNGSYPS